MYENTMVELISITIAFMWSAGICSEILFLFSDFVVAIVIKSVGS